MRKFNVKVNGVSYAVEVEEVGAFAAPSFVPAPEMPKEAVAAAPVAVVPAAKAPAAAAAPVKAGGTEIPSPLPGDVRKLLVADGSVVKAGDKILVLEAMKMENDIVSTAGGTISYAVKVGDHIDTGEIIAYIK